MRSMQTVAKKQRQQLCRECVSGQIDAVVLKQGPEV
jgi:hypothetical protein